MVLRDGPDIGIVKYDNSVEIILTEYMTVREMIMSITDAEMVDEKELLKWRNQFLELEEIQSEWKPKRGESRVSHWDERD
jgi:ferredoxin-fold anticodon binding domain-containing protein